MSYYEIANKQYKGMWQAIGISVGIMVLFFTAFQLAHGTQEDSEEPTLRDVLQLIREHNQVNEQFRIGNVTINGVGIPVDSLIFFDDKKEAREYEENVDLNEIVNEER